MFLHSLSTNGHHPLARCGTVSIRIPDIPPQAEDTHARVFGDKLAIQYIMYSPEQVAYLYTFTVMNWKSGQILHVSTTVFSFKEDHSNYYR